MTGLARRPETGTNSRLGHELLHGTPEIDRRGTKYFTAPVVWLF